MAATREELGSGRRGLLALGLAVAGLLTSVPAASAADVLTNNDGVIRDSLCVGFDCPDSPGFGSDTTRLQENNTRLHFDDTSTASGFPANDWRLIANDQASGGRNMFAIQDATLGRIPFLVSAGAPVNAFFMDSQGDIGIGTDNPVLDMHVSTSNTPGLRLEQTNAGGFTAETWDIAGNEANFFVRDVTNGSRLPFRIRPGAPTSAIDIAASGNVGVNTPSPSAPLHVRDPGSNDDVLTAGPGGVGIGTASPTADFQVENIDGGSNTSVWFNNATAQGGAGATWANAINNQGDFAFNLVGTGGAEALFREFGHPNTTLLVRGPVGATDFKVVPLPSSAEAQEMRDEGLKPREGISVTKLIDDLEQQNRDLEQRMAALEARVGE